MPKLNVRNAGLVQGGGVNVRADAQALGGGVSRAISGLGAAVGVIEQKQQKALLDKQRNEATNFISSERLAKIDFAQQARIDNPDITAEEMKQLLSDFDQKAIESAPKDNKFIADNLARNLDETGSKELFRAHAADAKRNLESQLQTISDSENKANNIVISDPSRLAEMDSLLTGMIKNSTLLNENAKKEKIANIKSSLVTSSFETRLDKGSSNYDPQGALRDLNSHKFDSVLDSSSKSKLVAAATVKSDEETFTQQAGALQSAFPNPRDRMDYLTKTNPVDIQKRFGLKAGAVMRLANYANLQVKSNIAEEKRQKEAQKEEISKQVSDLTIAGKSDEAVALVEASDAYPTVHEKVAVITSIRSENLASFDPQVFHSAENDIASGKMEHKSDIDKLITSRENKDLLRKQWDEHKSGLGTFNYFNSAKDRFKKLQKEFNLDVTEGEFAARLLNRARTEGISPTDDRMNDLADDLLKKVEGTGNTVFGIPVGRDKFGVELPTQSSHGLPNGVTEEDIQATMKKHNMTRDEVLQRISK